MDQVAQITEDIEKFFDIGQVTGVVFLDLTAAYNTVWLTGKDGSTIRSEFAYCVPRNLNRTVPAYRTSVQFLKRTVPTYRSKKGVPYF